MVKWPLQNTMDWYMNDVPPRNWSMCGLLGVHSSSHVSDATTVCQPHREQGYQKVREEFTDN